jgi:TPR repeat protein
MFGRALLRILLSAQLAFIVSAARAADRGPYAPENIENTEKGFYWVCMVRPICPVSDKMLDLVKRVVEHDRSAEYQLGLALMRDDELSADPALGLAWMARAAEQGEPHAARDIAARLRAGAVIDVDKAKVEQALKAQAAAGDIDSSRALADMTIVGPKP